MRTKRLWTAANLAAALCAATVAAGCASHRETVAQWRQSLPSKILLPRRTVPEIRSAPEPESLVLREYEFDSRKAPLNARGVDHLQAISGVLPESDLPVWIEPLTGPDAALDASELESLNELRRRGVVQELLARGIVDAEQRVVVGLPVPP